MAKNSRRKKEYGKNASLLHKAVGDMLANSVIFQNYRIYQEYPVNRISPYFDKGRERFDWVIMDLMLIIECHGKQHYEPVRFGGITEEEAEVNFQEQQLRDLRKMRAAHRAGWTYVVFKYDQDDINIGSFMAKINEAKRLEENQGYDQQDRNVVAQQVKDKKKPKKDDGYYKRQLEKAKEYRKACYRKWKRKKDGKSS